MTFKLADIVTPQARKAPEPPARQDPHSLGLCAVGKQMFTRKDADRMLVILNRQELQPMRRFLCGVCNHYHLGHARGRS